MNLNYNIQKIDKALQDFHNATGINMRLLNADFSSISHVKNADNNYCKCIKSTSSGRKFCSESDRELFSKCKKSRKSEMHICHAGLIDIAIPLIYDNEIIGYIILGQMKGFESLNNIKEYLTELGLDANETEKFYNDLSELDYNKIKSIENIAIMLGKYLLLENLLKPYSNKNIESALLYIQNNFEKPLTIQTIAENINLSKSSLYKYFHSHFNCTVNEYINSKRVEKAVKLLGETDLSIEEISQQTGFASAAYFSRTFKKEKGITPLKFRKTVAPNL